MYKKVIKQAKPLSIIYNKKSGFHAANKDEVYEKPVWILSDHDFEIQSFELRQEASFDTLMSKVFARHQRP